MSKDMPTSEHELRAALATVLSTDDGFLRKTLTHFEELVFLPNDAVLGRASLRGSQLTGTGNVAVYLSPRSRVLKVVAQFSDPAFSSTVTYQLRAYRPKTTDADESDVRT